MSAIPQGVSREEWLQALPRALVVAFVKTDMEFQKKGTRRVFFVSLLELYLFMSTHSKFNFTCRGNFWNDSYVCDY